jgi:hypothetical protein
LPAVVIKEAAWRKSGASGQEGCVEVAAVTSSILVRDSKNPHGQMLAFSGQEWLWFLTRMGEH